MHALGARKVTCLDIGADWQPELRKIVEKYGVPADFIECTAGTTTDLPFEDNSFDFVASNGVLMHLETVEMARTALGELIRVAKSGGVVYSHIGIDKPGVVDRYIVKSLRQAYAEDAEFRDFIDTLDHRKLVDELRAIFESGIKIDETLNPGIVGAIAALLTLDSTTFFQNMLQVPVQQGPKLSQEWGIRTMIDLGCRNVRRVKESYWKRNDFRKYLAPVHYRLDSPIARLFYGNGHVKLVAEKC
jgi:SAM-dependent methyltransferase